MQITDLIQSFESWAPKWVAWEKDNVGLQVGDSKQRVTRVMVTLDVTRQVVAEAISRKVDLIVSHHPLLFRPPSSITTGDITGNLVIKLIRNNIALFSAHTNLDFARDGVSFTLADALGLEKVRFLTPLKNSLAKIIVFVPSDHVDQVIQVMAQAGAGIIGEYSSCSFSTKGRGSFHGSVLSNPFLGKRDTLEFVEERRLEMIAPRASVHKVVAAMKAAHPYEEVAYDVYHLDNPNPNFGMGVIGELPKSQSLSKFLKSVKRSLGSKALRYTGNTTSQIKKVAVSSGSGSELLLDAINAKADVFITADIRYHTFHAAAESISLVDAGHWETEHVVLKSIANRIRLFAKAEHEPLLVFISEHSTNLIQIM